MAAHAPGFLQVVNEAKKVIQECTVEDVQKWKSEGRQFHFVDCREDNEWIAGRAAGAIHIGKGVIERDIEATIPDKGSEIVIYCGGGFRSALAAEALQKMGYRKVISMDGGIRAWRAAGLPEEKG
jgi:rhodanese-related sulfurtransferase